MSQAQQRNFLSRHPIILAAFIFLLLIAWLMSGDSSIDESEADSETAAVLTFEPAKVQVKTFIASPVEKAITLYGRTEPDRVTTLKAEVKGRIEQVLVLEGSEVTKGQAILRVAENDLQQKLASAKATQAQRELEYQGAIKLKKQGYQAETQLADATAKLTQASAEVARLELDIRHTTILAPFSGVFNQTYVEEGDYVKIGDPVAMIADLDPLIVRADVNEANISQIELSQAASVRLVNGDAVVGEVRYISRVADAATNTFKIEVAIANDNSTSPAGISAELSLPLFTADAIKVSPALLALDEKGNIGVKTIVNNVVEFVGIDIIKSESDGVWLTGFGAQADLIILGQGFVRIGDTVNAVYAE